MGLLSNMEKYIEEIRAGGRRLEQKMDRMTKLLEEILAELRQVRKHLEEE